MKVLWSGVPLTLLLVSLTAPIICQEQQPPRGYEQQTMFWLDIKRGLTGPNGKEYFAALKDATIPRGHKGLTAFEGTLVSSTPVQHPNEFLVAMPGEKTPEVTLKLKGHIDKPLPVGTPVSFEGTVKAFVRAPFMLTLEVETVNRAVRPDDLPSRSKDSK
jgi:hypothetical protein